MTKADASDAGEFDLERAHPTLDRDDCHELSVDRGLFSQAACTEAHGTGVAALTLSGENGLDVELSGPLVSVPLIENGPGIAVFELGGMKIVRDDLTLVPSADGVALSQEVFFLGYPLTGTLPLMGRLPAVRRGIVSQRAHLNGVAAWIIDGHNLPGFSGGPLVFADAGGMGSTWHVLGVVSGD